VPPGGARRRAQDAAPPLAPAALVVEPRLSSPKGGFDITDPTRGTVIPNPSELAILGSIMVLNFHCIGKSGRKLVDGERDVCVQRRQFAEILDVVSGRNEVRLTFDDGNRSDVTEALPELVRRGLHAEFFICPARFGTAGFLDEDDVRELREAGMSIGSHGMDHVRWRRLGSSEIDREIVQAKRRLEDALQMPVETAACPFGVYDRRTLSALRAAGFKRVYTSDGGRAGATDWLVARNTVRRVDSAESVERLLDSSPKPDSLLLKGKRWIKRWR
jgi:peptidoglycan/xylan/chitin deacetylase (PgdA/CDA1 family)